MDILKCSGLPSADVGGLDGRHQALRDEFTAFRRRKAGTLGPRKLKGKFIGEVIAVQNTVKAESSSVEPSSKPASPGVQVKQRRAVDTTKLFEKDASAHTVGDYTVPDPRITTRHVNVFYGEKQAIFDVNLDIAKKEVIALIGPSGCGKSTYLRCLNRMNDTIEICRVAGEIKLDGVDIYHDDIDPVVLRARVGMVFQKPNPFPKSIFDNVAYGPRIHGLTASKSELEEIVEKALKRAGLWNEVKDRLDQPGTGLSGGQQQRLCIARAIAVNPEVLLMDEPCSALDPIATATIEQLIDELSRRYSIVIVTHSMQQAARVSHRTAYFHLGKLIEVGKTSQIFTNPRHPLTEDYITGRFG